MAAFFLSASGRFLLIFLGTPASNLNQGLAASG